MRWKLWFSDGSNRKWISFDSIMNCVEFIYYWVGIVEEDRRKRMIFCFWFGFCLDKDKVVVYVFWIVIRLLKFLRGYSWWNLYILRWNNGIIEFNVKIIFCLKMVNVIGKIMIVFFMRYYCFYRFLVGWFSFIFMMCDGFCNFIIFKYLLCCIIYSGNMMNRRNYG